MDNALNRKEFLKKFSLMGVAAVGASTLITACGGGGEQTETAQAPAASAADPCTDVSGLTENDLQMRANVNYVEQTEIPEQRCDNCQLYKQPENGGCGGCLLFAGPVTAAGWCSSWVPNQG
ncbi:MAG: high potential FeS protein [Bacteroidetes bacterium HLUCCA01]|nr:MAG: high potential FeS protein [Bacteroidetes bacterium HLUCCA01]